jgi:GNAT superfamily N-acetyltransferase
MAATNRVRVVCSWAQDVTLADTLAAFFAQHVDTHYISHGELLDELAESPDRWHPDLELRVRDSLRSVLGSDPSERVAIARVEDTLVGLAIIEIVHTRHRIFAMLHDIVVARTHRGMGVGTAIMTWLEDQLLAEDVSVFMLESGAKNHRAHQFFERHGFTLCSRVMIKHAH